MTVPVPTHLDGNAIAGLLFDVFGAEMTTATGVCASCGAAGQLAESAVYVHAPGIVVRCRSCSSVLMVLLTRHRTVCFDRRGLSALTPASDKPYRCGERDGRA